MQATENTIDVWAVEGRFMHLLYSPKGEIEGLMIDTDGIATQFVCEPGQARSIHALKPGTKVVLEGTEAPPSPKGEAAHTVYHLERVAMIGGSAPRPHALAGEPVTGRVVHFNHARHGEPNGVVLDSGHFIHLRPDGMRRVAPAVGDMLSAEGPARPLATGTGQVIEATRVNGIDVRPAHGA